MPSGVIPWILPLDSVGKDEGLGEQIRGKVRPASFLGLKCAKSYSEAWRWLEQYVEENRWKEDVRFYGWIKLMLLLLLLQGSTACPKCSAGLLASSNAFEVSPVPCFRKMPARYCSGYPRHCGQIQSVTASFLPP